jgi:hypothetical protein
LYETAWYENFNWDREKLKRKLKEDPTWWVPVPVIGDDTK